MKGSEIPDSDEARVGEKMQRQEEAHIRTRQTIWEDRHTCFHLTPYSM